jgi:hypothetical protein
MGRRAALGALAGFALATSLPGCSGASAAEPQVLQNTDAPFVRVPTGRYIVREPIKIQSGQVWEFENVVLECSAPGPAFLAQFHAWAIQGKVRLEGNPQAVGLRIEVSRAYSVTGMRFQVFGTAVQVIDRRDLSDKPRGDRGKFTDIIAMNCGTGFDVGNGAEYGTFTNISALGCERGVVVNGGSNQFNGGNVVDCTDGIVLVAGPNHAHGGFHGMNVNHNRRHNLLAKDIAYGHTFTGCHFYGDGPDKGTIQLTNCAGINITGGQLDCAVIADGGKGNVVANNVIAGPNFKVTGDIDCRGNTRLDGSDACATRPAG